MPLYSLINRNKLASSGCLLRFGVCILISTTPTHTHNSPNSPALATLFIFHGWQCFCQGIRQTFNLHTHTPTHTHSLNLTATIFQHGKLQPRKDEVRRPCKDLAGGIHCTGEWGRVFCKNYAPCLAFKPSQTWHRGWLWDQFVWRAGWLPASLTAWPRTQAVPPVLSPFLSSSCPWASLCDFVCVVCVLLKASCAGFNKNKCYL